MKRPIECCPLPLLLLVLSASYASAASPPVITKAGIGPVFSSGPNIQAGEWISIYGTNLAASTGSWTGNFPTTLNGTGVTVDGKPAYLWYASPTQLNVQAPDDSFIGSVNVVVTTASGSATSTVSLAAAAPSFSLLDATHVAGIILRTDGSGHYGAGTYDIVGPTGSSLGYYTVAARPGDNVVLYAVGLGPTNPAVPSGQPFSGAASVVHPPTITLGSYQLAATFAGIIGPGLYQLNLTIPATSSFLTGDFPIRISLPYYGISSSATTVLSMQAAATPKVTSLFLSPTTVTAGGSSAGTVTLSSAAPAGGAAVSLTAGGGTAVSVPASVQIAAGASSATFTIVSQPVNSATNATISATYGGGTATASLLVQAAANPQCASVAGYWYATENGSATANLIASGQDVDTETDPVVGGNNITIAQTGCTFTYNPVVNSGLFAGDTSFVRTGTVKGGNVTVTGLLASLSNIETYEEGENPGLVINSANVSTNQMTGTGTINASLTQMNISETGEFLVTGSYSYAGTSGGYTYSITTTSSAVFSTNSLGSPLRRESGTTQGYTRPDISVASDGPPLSLNAQRAIAGAIRNRFTKKLRFSGITAGKQ